MRAYASSSAVKRVRMDRVAWAINRPSPRARGNECAFFFDICEIFVWVNSINIQTQEKLASSSSIQFSRAPGEVCAFDTDGWMVVDGREPGRETERRRLCAFLVALFGKRPKRRLRTEN